MYPEETTAITPWMCTKDGRNGSEMTIHGEQCDIKGSFLPQSQFQTPGPNTAKCFLTVYQETMTQQFLVMAYRSDTIFGHVRPRLMYKVHLDSN